MAEYTSAYTGAEIDANLALAETALQSADMATTVSLAASAVQPADVADTISLAASAVQPIHAGDLTFSGAGGRIRGDYSNNSTATNRTAFQSSVTNGVTTVGFMPNGTSTGSGVRAYNNSDPTNASFIQLGSVSGLPNIQSSRNGTGNYLGLSITVDGTPAMYITASGTSTAGSNPLVLIRATTTTDTVTPLQVTGAIKSSVYTVATLPVGTAGCRSFVSDANATHAAGIGNAVVAGGANFVPVYHNGTSWLIG